MGALRWVCEELGNLGIDRRIAWRYHRTAGRLQVVILPLSYMGLYIIVLHINGQDLFLGLLPDLFFSHKKFNVLADEPVSRCIHDSIQNFTPFEDVWQIMDI